MAVNGSRLKWQKNTRREITQEEWIHSHTLLRTLAIRENFFKVRHRWHLTPNRIARMFPGADGCYWRCHEEKGDFQHIWWTYWLGWRAFWLRVYKEITVQIQIHLCYSLESWLVTFKAA